MKKIIAVIALIVSFAFCSVPLQAQESDSTSDSLATTQTIVQERVGLHKQIQQKFIEGSPFFMSIVALVLVIGLAFCIERIIYLNMAETDSKRLLDAIKDALSKGDTEMAKNICHNTHGPVASICGEGLEHIDQSADVVEKSITAQGNRQIGLLDKGCSWISLFIKMAPILGFVGTVVGMVMAFDKVQQMGDVSASVIAGGMKVALITTIFGLVAGLILQIFYNYILSKIESMTNDMEDSSIALLDMVIKYNLKYKR